MECKLLPWSRSLPRPGLCLVPLILGSSPLGSLCSSIPPFILLVTPAWAIPTSGPLHTFYLAGSPNFSRGHSCQSFGFSSWWRPQRGPLVCLFLFLHPVPCFFPYHCITANSLAGILRCDLGQFPNVTSLWLPYLSLNYNISASLGCCEASVQSQCKTPQQPPHHTPPTLPLWLMLRLLCNSPSTMVLTGETRTCSRQDTPTIASCACLHFTWSPAVGKPFFKGTEHTPPC